MYISHLLPDFVAQF